MPDPLFETAFKLLDKGWNVNKTRAYLLKTAEKFGFSKFDVEEALKNAQQSVNLTPPSACPACGTLPEEAEHDPTCPLASAGG